MGSGEDTIQKRYASYSMRNGASIIMSAKVTAATRHWTVHCRWSSRIAREDCSQVQFGGIICFTVTISATLTSNGDKQVVYILSIDCYSCQCYLAKSIKGRVLIVCTVWTWKTWCSWIVVDEGHPPVPPLQCWLMTTSPLQWEHWEDNLARHTDGRFVEYIVKGIRECFGVIYNYGTHSCKKAIEHPEVIWEYMARECDEGQVLGPFEPSLYQKPRRAGSELSQNNPQVVSA